MSEIEDEAYSEAMGEIERLKKEQSRDVDHIRMLTKDLISHEAEIERLKVLLTRAADALGPYALGFPDGSDVRALIAEMRKAAE